MDEKLILKNRFFRALSESRRIDATTGELRIIEPETPPFDADTLTDFIYYKKIPEVYRIADEEDTDRDFYRFLLACFTGAFAGNSEEEGLLVKAAMMKSLVNPETCPAKYLPYLYASWGLPYFEDIGIYYNRKFLSNIGEFLRRRGTIGGIRYMVRTLTGLECDIEYERIMTDRIQARNLYITLVAKSISKLTSLELTANVVNRFLEQHVPYYIRVIIKDGRAEVNEHLDVDNVPTRFMSSYGHYDLSLFEIAPFAYKTQVVPLNLHYATPLYVSKRQNLAELENRLRDGSISKAQFDNTPLEVIAEKKEFHFDWECNKLLPENKVKMTEVQVRAIVQSNRYDFSHVHKLGGDMKVNAQKVNFASYFKHEDLSVDWLDNESSQSGKSFHVPKVRMGATSRVKMAVHVDWLKSGLHETFIVSRNNNFSLVELSKKNFAERENLIQNKVHYEDKGIYSSLLSSAIVSHTDLSGVNPVESRGLFGTNLEQVSSLSVYKEVEFSWRHNFGGKMPVINNPQGLTLQFDSYKISEKQNVIYDAKSEVSSSKYKNKVRLAEEKNFSMTLKGTFITDGLHENLFVKNSNAGRMSTQTLEDTSFYENSLTSGSSHSVGLESSPQMKITESKSFDLSE